MIGLTICYSHIYYCTYSMLFSITSHYIFSHINFITHILSHHLSQAHSRSERHLIVEKIRSSSSSSTVTKEPSNHPHHHHHHPCCSSSTYAHNCSMSISSTYVSSSPSSTSYVSTSTSTSPIRQRKGSCQAPAAGR